jgi:plastocyanin
MSVRRATPWVVAVLGALILVAAACGGGSGSFDVSSAGDRQADLSYDIPAGAGDAIDHGRPLDLLPERLDVHVGEVIEIVNHDDRGHLIGPFFVGRGETVRQRFASAGQFTGECSVHSSGQIVIDVT